VDGLRRGHDVSVEASLPAVMPTKVGTQTSICITDVSIWLDPGLRRDDV
jgi:hypothetical protein